MCYNLTITGLYGCSCPSRLFQHLPQMGTTTIEDADIAWQIYSLNHDHQSQRFKLTRAGIQYTHFREALDTITRPSAGNLNEFIEYLNGRVANKQTQGLPPNAGISPDVVPPADHRNEKYPPRPDERIANRK